jgi:hypothetical protein
VAQGEKWRHLTYIRCVCVCGWVGGGVAQTWYVAALQERHTAVLKLCFMALLVQAEAERSSCLPPQTHTHTPRAVCQGGREPTACGPGAAHSMHTWLVGRCAGRCRCVRAPAPSTCAVADAACQQRQTGRLGTAAARSILAQGQARAQCLQNHHQICTMVSHRLPQHQLPSLQRSSAKSATASAAQHTHHHRCPPVESVTCVCDVCVRVRGCEADGRDKQQSVRSTHI